MAALPEWVARRRTPDLWDAYLVGVWHPVVTGHGRASRRAQSAWMARAVLSSLRLTAIALAGVGLVSLAVNFFAVKGAWAWGQFADQIPNIRVGGYWAIGGYLLAVAVGGLRAARR